jgi:hypothetical protein
MAIELSRGSYVKFLHADDTLAPGCLEEMVTLALEDERIGLFFARREIVIEGEEDPAWSRTYSMPHSRFTGLERTNDGRELFKQLVDAGIEENWIGEPSAVMVSRRAREQCGAFNARVHQIGDLDLWLRIMLRHRVGFIDKPLCIYRHHSRSTTATNRRVGRDWLDRLWLLDALLATDTIEREEVERLRGVALRRAVRTQVGRLWRGRFETELPAYLVQRALALVGRRRPSPVGPRAPADRSRAAVEI